jgi:hypothetical protein
METKDIKARFWDMIEHEITLLVDPNDDGTTENEALRKLSLDKLEWLKTLQDIQCLVTFPDLLYVTRRPDNRARID